MSSVAITDVALTDFSSALLAIRHGMRARRAGWNGKGQFIALYSIYAAADFVDDGVCMTQPFIYMDTTRLDNNVPSAVKGRTPWLASQVDLLATDWIIMSDEEE